MNIFTQVAKNTLAQVLGRIVTTIFSIALVVLLTRYFGKSGYGEYAFITAFVLLFASISDWGTNIIAVREASQNKAKQPRIFGTILIFRLFLATVAVVLSNIAIRVNPTWESLVRPVSLASLVLIFLSAKTSLSVVFQTKLSLEKAAFVDAAASALFFVLALVVLIAQKGIYELMAVWVLATLISGLFGFYLARELAKITLGFDFQIIRRVFWEALPMGTLLVVFSIYNRIDIVILQHFKGEAEVGIYGLAYKIHDNLVLGAAFLMNSIFPIISQNFSSGKIKTLKSIYQKTFDILLLAGLPVLGLFFVFAPQVIAILGGQEFSDSGVALRILVFATFVSYFNHLTGYSLVAFGKQKISLVIGVLALLFNVTANWIFIPLYSWRAAATITVLTESLVFILSSVVVFKILKFLPKPTSVIKTIKILIASRGKIF